MKGSSAIHAIHHLILMKSVIDTINVSPSVTGLCVVRVAIRCSLAQGGKLFHLNRFSIETHF